MKLKFTITSIRTASLLLAAIFNLGYADAADDDDGTHLCGGVPYDPNDYICCEGTNVCKLLQTKFIDIHLYLRVFTFQEFFVWFSG